MRQILACLLLCLLVGCASPYERHFVSDLGITPPPVSEYAQHNLVVYQGVPDVIRRPMTEELKAEMADQQFVLIGHATFNGRYANPKQVTEMAQKLGAQMVIVDIQPSHRQTELEKETDLVPLESRTTYVTQEADGSTRRHTAITHVDVEQTQYVPRTYQYYDHKAYFYTKSSK